MLNPYERMRRAMHVHIQIYFVMMTLCPVS
jgi:hypothetical protein